MATVVAALGAWTLQSQDTQQIGRFHDNVFLSQASGTPNNITRNGVIPTVMQGGNATPIDLLVTTPGGMAVTVGPGNAVLAGQGAPTASRGPYIGMSNTNISLTVSGSNPSNPRLDLVYMQVIDGTPGAGDAGTTACNIGIVTGVPAGSPVLPSVPAVGVCIPLGQVNVAAGASAVTVTDLRRSAGPSPRFLLPGDALSDPGFRYGEMRQRRLSTYALSAGADPIVTDKWGFDNTWHGTQSLPLPAGSIVTNTTNFPTAEAAMYTITVPDPGFPYYVDVDAQAFRNLGTSQGYGQLKVYLNSLAGTVMFTEIEETNFAGTSVNLRANIWNGAVGTPFTGAKTLVVSALASVTGSLAAAPQSCFAEVKPV